MQWRNLALQAHHLLKCLADFLSQQSILYGKDMDVHKISKASETTDLDLYLTDSSESTQHAERLPHPTMSLFIKPQLHRYPRLAAGRRVSREKAASKTSAAGRKTHHDLPDDVEALRINMERAKNEKKENSYVWPGNGCNRMGLTCFRIVPRFSMLP